MSEELKRKLVIPLNEALVEMGGLNQIKSNGTIDVSVDEGVTKLTVKEGQLPSDSIDLLTVDLDTVITPGNYHQAQGSYAVTQRNYPVNGGGGNLLVLDVFLPSGTGGFRQIFIVYTGDIWVRYSSNGVHWTPWALRGPKFDPDFFLPTGTVAQSTTLKLAETVTPKSSKSLADVSINNLFEPGFYHNGWLGYSGVRNGWPKDYVPGMLMVTSGTPGGSYGGRNQVVFGMKGESFIRHAHTSGGWSTWLPLGISNNYYGYKAPANILPNVLWTNTSRTYTTVKVLATSLSPFSIEGEYLLKAGETPLVVSKATSIPNTSGEHSATIEVTVAPSQQFRWRVTEGTGELTGKIITHEFLPLT